MFSVTDTETEHYSWACFGFLGTGLPPFQREMTDFLREASIETLLARDGEQELRAAFSALSPEAASFLTSIVDQLVSPRYQLSLGQMQQFGLSL